MTKLLDDLEVFRSLKVPLVPMHGIVNGLCTCRQKSTCVRPGRHPRILDPARRATLDKNQLTAWLREWPDSNLGGVTGARSEIMAVSVTIGSDGDHKLRAFAAKCSPLLSNIEFNLADESGKILLFRCPPNVAIPSTAGILRGVTILGEDGIVPLPISFGESTDLYQNLPPTETELLQLPPPPVWLIAMARARLGYEERQAIVVETLECLDSVRKKIPKNMLDIAASFLRQDLPFEEMASSLDMALLTRDLARGNYAN